MLPWCILAWPLDSGSRLPLSLMRIGKKVVSRLLGTLLSHIAGVSWSLRCWPRCPSVWLGAAVVPWSGLACPPTRLLWRLQAILLGCFCRSVYEPTAVVGTGRACRSFASARVASASAVFQLGRLKCWQFLAAGPRCWRPWIWCRPRLWGAPWLVCTGSSTSALVLSRRCPLREPPSLCMHWLAAWTQQSCTIHSDGTLGWRIACHFFDPCWTSWIRSRWWCLCRQASRSTMAELQQSRESQISSTAPPESSGCPLTVMFGTPTSVAFTIDTGSWPTEELVPT
mmetsp:Transcript_29475/g.75529  ORF Transcript_29475/g.75529 Transcript_29475/m.75529 type:complete len:283 (+) Transcript_29475:1368-2216(+)